MKYFTFIGNHDAIEHGREGQGAALTIFYKYKDELDGVYILTSKDKPHYPYEEMAKRNQHMMQSENKDLPVSVITVDMENPVNFDLVFKVMLDKIQNIVEKDSIQHEKKIVNITSGTPTMTTCWVLLQQSGLFENAKLIQSFETNYQRQYGKTCQEVDLTIDNFPEITAPSEVKRELNRANQELKVLKDEKAVIEIDHSTPQFIGESPKIRSIKEQIISLVDKDTHVLILGEPGTGKEIVAQSIWDIHRKSIDKDFNTYDCGALSSNLIISELFGYEKGAFTGANTDKAGIIETCNGKMLFLDEIGNISRNNQNVLLRLLDTGEWKRVGSTHTKKSNIQIVAATNKDVNDEEIFGSDIRDRFHETIQIPPLRERISDIVILTKHFLLSEQRNVSFDKTIYEMLRSFSWPGNVRQLQHWVKRVCRMFKDTELTWNDIPEMLHPDEYNDNPKFEFPDLPIDLYEYVTALRLFAIKQGGTFPEADKLLGLKEGTLKQWNHQRKNKS